MVGTRKRFAVVWRRAGLGIRVFIFGLGAALFALLVLVQRSDEETGGPGGSLIVLSLVNFIVVVLLVLAFLIGRNIVKLIFDRRRGILGSKLRTRLVVAFVGLTLIPTAILFVLASGLLTRSIEGWFGTTVESAVSGAVEVGRRHHTFLKDYQFGVLGWLKADLTGRWQSFTSLSDVHQWLETERKKLGLFGVRIINGDGTELTEAHNAVATIDSFREPDLDRAAFTTAQGGDPQVRFEERENSQFIRAYGKLEIPPSYARLGKWGGREPLVMVTSLRVSPELTQALHLVNDSFREYEQLKLFRGAIKSNYVLTLTMMTGLLIFSAIWIAFYIARAIAVPIQRLAEATRLVARGRYDVQIRDVGDDEMGMLVRSFNEMTGDLRKSRTEQERHRAFIEAILENLAVGVIAIDRNRVITSMNAPAATTFGLERPSEVVGKNLAQVLSPADQEQLQPLLDGLDTVVEGSSSGTKVLDRELTVKSKDRDLKIVCTVGIIKQDDGTVNGYALLFDDVTELSKAQHVAAWREVAQRIAHEIKNPLTPIQLSAQRLEKLMQDTRLELPADLRTKIVDSSQTIVEYVDSIKRLANEFSQFARMPQAEFSATRLNDLIASIVEPFATTHRDLVFQVIVDNALPEVSLDREQIRRVLINLIDNAVAAIRTSPEGMKEGGKITVRSVYDARARSAIVEVSDTGPGIPPQEKQRIFEPYFTTKKGGTGLGLAIVTTIVSDHQGRVRVFDNSPRGAKFVVELPLQPQKSTQRRFAA